MAMEARLDRRDDRQPARGRPRHHEIAVRGRARALRVDGAATRRGRH